MFRVEVETPCKMGNLLDPTLENPPANLEDTIDVSRQGNGDMLMTIEVVVSLAYLVVMTEVGIIHHSCFHPFRVRCFLSLRITC